MKPLDKKAPHTVGQAAPIDFPFRGLKKVPARIDTGARTSSIWASNIHEKNGELTFVLFDKKSAFYTGEVLSTVDYSMTVVANSTGHEQMRYKVRQVVRLGGRRIRAHFTLADRSKQVYPVLIGRNVLRGKFIVDVKQGRLLQKEDRQRTHELQAKIIKLANE